MPQKNLQPESMPTEPLEITKPLAPTGEAPFGTGQIPITRGMPGGLERIPTTGEAPLGMSPEQMKEDLDGMYERVKSKERQVNSRELMDKNELRNMKARLIQTFFEFMQEHGVNPDDLGSINKFLGQLQAQDPDLHELFEMAFTGLIKEEGVEPEGEPGVESGVEPGLDQRFKNIQEQMLRYQK